MMKTPVNFSVIYENPIFVIYHGSGGWKESFGTWSPYNPDGSSAKDTFAFCSVECVAAGYDLQQRVIPAWTEVNDFVTVGGPKAFLFNQPWEYWCVCSTERSNADDVSYRIGGRLVRPRAGQTGNLDVVVGDYVAVLRGNAIIDGTSYFPFSVFEASEAATLPVEAVTDVIAIRIRVLPRF